MPLHHELGDGKRTPGNGAPTDKPFDDEVVTLERLQSVQCDRCSKWRLVDPDYKVRVCSGGRVLHAEPRAARLLEEDSIEKRCRLAGL